AASPPARRAGLPVPRQPLRLRDERCGAAAIQARTRHEMVRTRLREAARPALTQAIRAVRAVRRRAVRPRGFLRSQPVSRKFGLDRGTAIDRAWIEAFLAREARRIRGSVLEIGDPGHTRRFGTG